VRLLRSHRFRRRALRVGIALAVLTAIVLPFSLIQNKKGTPTQAAPPSANEGPLQIVKNEQEVSLTRADRRQITRLVNRFVPDVVGRRDLAAGYDLVTAQLAGNRTRARWVKSTPPTLDYKARGRTFGWTFNYAFPGEANVNVVLEPARGNRQGGWVFTADLKRVRGSWRVDSFVPVAQFGELNGHRRLVAASDFTPQGLGGKETPKGRIAPVWLALPAIPILLVLSIPIWLGVRSRRAHKRSEREFREAFGR
jgi:hypothetical protein